MRGPLRNLWVIRRTTREVMQEVAVRTHLLKRDSYATLQALAQAWESYRQLREALKQCETQSQTLIIGYQH